MFVRSEVKITTSSNMANNRTAMVSMVQAVVAYQSKMNCRVLSSFMPPPPLGAGGIMFWGCPSVDLSVHPKPCEHDILKKLNGILPNFYG